MLFFFLAMAALRSGLGKRAFSPHQGVHDDIRDPSSKPDVARGSLRVKGSTTSGEVSENGARTGIVSDLERVAVKARAVGRQVACRGSLARSPGANDLKVSFAWH